MLSTLEPLILRDDFVVLATPLCVATASIGQIPDNFSTAANWTGSTWRGTGSLRVQYAAVTYTKASRAESYSILTFGPALGTYTQAHG